MIFIDKEKYSSDKLIQESRLKAKREPFFVAIVAP
jgi:hypothetical protein